MKGFFRKNPLGALVADDTEAQELLSKIKINSVVSCEIKRPRNVRLHRKFFSLLKCAYAQMDYDNILFDDFRSQVVMLAGYRREVHSIATGQTRWEPQSISFAAMSQDDFEKLYDRTIDVLLRFVLKKYTRDDVTNVMDEIAEFG